MVVQDARGAAPTRGVLVCVPGFADALSLNRETMRPRALETALARGEPSPVAGDPVAMLEHAFPEVAGATRLPRGALSRIGDGGELDERWTARADPVHLAAVRDHVRLLPLTDLAIQEARDAGAACNALLAEHGLALEAPVAHRWYLRAGGALDVEAQPTDEVAGHDVYDFLPSGPDGPFVKRVLTEVQMTLHAHPMNAIREARGAPVLNSLWIWGGGVLPHPRAIALPMLRSDDPVVRGLWRLHGGETGNLPDAGGAALPGVVVWRGLEQAVRADPAACGQALAWLDAQLVAPALDALRSGAVERVELALGGAGTYAIDRRALARWWRRGKTLVAGRGTPRAR
jgi:hypothetical protein